MKRLVTLLILVFIVLSPVASFSEEARIKNTLITNNKKELIVYFQLHGPFTPKIEEAIQTGIPTTFIYRIILYKKSSPSSKTKLTDLVISRSIKYDSLKKDYTVTMSDRKDPAVKQDLSAAKELMSRIEAIPVVPLEMLQKDSQYVLYVKAEMDKIKLPIPLNYLFFFVSYWDFETDWDIIEFTY